MRSEAARSARGATPAVAFGLALLVLISGNVLAGAPSGAPAVARPAGGAAGPAASLLPATYPTTNVTLAVNSSSVNLSSDFFGTTVNNEVHLLHGELNDINATPARVLVWPGAMAGEDYDPFTQTHYDTDTGVPTHALTTEAQFVQLCEAIHCTAIMQVPAEIDSPSFAERIVNYTEQNLSFHPAFWMIGNEPELWEHWKVPWKNWGSDYTTGPDPTQFGQEVVSYVKAIRQVDNTTPILGLPASGCTCGSWTFAQWIAGVLKVTGDQIQAVAFHEYPAGWLGTGDGSLQDFYDTISGAASIPVRIVAAREAVQSSCSGCNVSVFVSELGAALSWSAYGQYADAFSGSLSIASQITQAMADNVTNVDLFAAELATTNSWFAPSGAVRPDYGLYTEILDHLGPQAFSVNVTGSNHAGYAIDTLAPNDAGRRDLLVVNDNLTHAIAFTPKFAEGSFDAPVLAYYWNGSIHTTKSNGTQWVEPYTSNAVPQAYPDGLPGTYTLPPQSLVLFESYPGGASYVRVNATGVPNGSAWDTSLGPQFYTTTASNLSLLLPAGSYPIEPAGIPLPIGGKEFVPDEQLGGFTPSPAVVAGASTTLTIAYVPQWRVNVTTSGLGGNVTPEVGWWNMSQPLSLSETPWTGWAFDRWSGWGPGSYNGTNRSITIVPGGPLVEKALFVPGNLINLQEVGLPPGTPWSVTIRGETSDSALNYLALYEPNGTFGFSVSEVPGYRAIPRNGSFTSEGSWTVVVVRFVRITPPGSLFPVTFRVSGLPAEDVVPITVRGATETAGSADPEFQLLNGSYAYTLGLVPGYHASVPEKTFEVGGGPLVVDVPFVPTVYRTTWEATGVRQGVNWSLNVDGTTIEPTSTWASLTLPNGTYAYSVDLPANYSVEPRAGEITVDGYGKGLYLLIAPMMFPAAFEVVGGSVPAGWSVRFGNLTQGTIGTSSEFLAANGSYTFDVHPPAGYYAVPSHGRVTVAGPAALTEIRFYPTSEKPSAALVAALSSGALTVSIWIGAAVGLGYAALRTLRRRGD